METLTHNTGVFTTFPDEIKKHPTVPVFCREDGYLFWVRKTSIPWTRGSKRLDGRRQVRIDKINHFSHSLIAESFLTKEHEDDVVDHWNGIRDDNRVCNLHFCSQKTNMANKHGLPPPEYHPEITRKQQQDSYKRNRETRLASCKQYYEENKDYVCSRQREYYHKNREKCLSRHNEWYLQHREEMLKKMHENYLKRKARKAAV